MTITKRNKFIDITKGATIFLMLWGHCIQYCVFGSNIDFFENNVFKTIYSFHMPLFMLISGYLFYFSFSKRDIKELLVHRTQAMVQPIVMGSVFNYLVTTVLFGILNRNVTPLFDGSWIYSLSSLWFLWSVLAASLAVTLICKKFDNVFIQIILLIVMVFFVAFFPNKNMNIYMYPYFVIGFYYGKYKEKLPAVVHRLKYLTIILYPVMMCFYEKKHYIYTTGLFPNETFSTYEMLIIDAYRWLIGLVGSIFVMTVIELAYKRIVTKSSHPIISEYLAKLGRKSLQIYVLSVPFLSVYLSLLFPKLLSFANIDNIFAKNMIIYNFAFTLPLAVAYSIGLYILLMILEKLKITKIMFGK